MSNYHLNVDPYELVGNALKIKEEKLSRNTIEGFATKFSLKELLLMYNNPNHISRTFKKIIRSKLSRGVLIPPTLRIQLYKILGLTSYHIHNNQGYYHKLLNIKKYPSYFENTIEKDVHRTTPSGHIGYEAKQQFHDQLRRILTAYSRRNPHIGYCQGFNYIVAFFIELKMDEEDVFYIFCHLIENIVPPDYYNSMTGVLCDDKLLDIILQIRIPNIKEKLEELQVQTSVFSIQWFVCLFTFHGTNKNIASVIMDHILAFGSEIIIKACVAHLELMEKDIMDTLDLSQMLMCMEQKVQKYDNQEKFSEKINSIFINKKYISLARDNIRQKFLDDKLTSDVLFAQKKFQQTSQLLTIRCNPNFAICLYVREKLKLEKEYFDQFVFRHENFNVIPNYCEDISKYKQQDTNEELVIGRDHHQCPQQNMNMRLSKVLSGSSLCGDWHVSIGDIKYAQYLNINDQIDYGRQSYALQKEPEVIINDHRKSQNAVKRQRSPFKEILLYPLKFLQQNKQQITQVKALQTISEYRSKSPLQTKRKNPIQLWKPNQDIISFRMKKRNNIQSTSYNSTQSQSIQELEQKKNDRLNDLKGVLNQSILIHEEEQNLKKLSVIIGQDESQLMHSSSVRFLADLVIGNEQLQNIFSKPISPKLSRHNSKIIKQNN